MRKFVFLLPILMLLVACEEAAITPQPTATVAPTAQPSPTYEVTGYNISVYQGEMVRYVTDAGWRCQKNGVSNENSFQVNCYNTFTNEKIVVEAVAFFTFTK
jgi:hypothetical protein